MTTYVQVTIDLHCYEVPFIKIDKTADSSYDDVQSKTSIYDTYLRNGYVGYIMGNWVFGKGYNLMGDIFIYICDIFIYICGLFIYI